MKLRISHLPFREVVAVYCLSDRTVWNHCQQRVACCRMLHAERGFHYADMVHVDDLDLVRDDGSVEPDREVVLGYVRRLAGDVIE